MSQKTINGQIFLELVQQGSLNLKKNKTIVNDLNVFPIPDGDTGDNMYMTISSGYNMAAGETSESIEVVSSKAANGMLFGARGNSGVILSRIFAGIANGFKGIEIATIEEFGKAFIEGIAQSYGAVSTPVEGTILTVFKDAANRANESINADSTLESFMEDFTKEARESLKRTPELLKVLKEAGVVDSGGAGLLYIAEGMLNLLKGNGIDDVATEQKSETVDLDRFGPDSELEFGYCTEFLLRLQNAKTDVEGFSIEKFTEYLNSMGNSVVAFKDGSIVKVHVHTFHPGLVLEHCREFGEFLTVKIENMSLQHSNTEVKNSFDLAEEAKNETEEEDKSFFRTDVRKKYGVVAVATGDGIKNIFEEICVDQVVDGGQSMNPSAEDLIEAFKKINADTIFVLPNNGNIILTAKQSAALYKDSEIRVIETHTIGDGYAVASMMDLSMDTAEEIEESAKEAMAGVVTGMVSQASRDAKKDGVEIKEGEYICFAKGTIIASLSAKNESALAMAKKLMTDEYAVLLVIRGENVSEEESDELVSQLGKEYKDVEVIPIDGKQPVFDYIMVFE